ncbi:UNKNOWN [Stylonychia lemnae]|uniref:Transmembrane protein n=1 Tax=Stylonychia lemnae TaxID=5949 RepID=A0A077ZX21_STYLE|nr:UNKNOWN [Stylonychia lemnae]|eukprot:CDW74466.1 UNKNOWN [Stylonychia lemnae]
MKNQYKNTIISCLVIVATYIAQLQGYSITSDCYGCLSSTSPVNKYCLSYEDASKGYCCDLSNTNDFCSQNKRFMCSDRTQSKSMKLYLCPNSASKCFSTSTSLDFDQNTFSKIIYAGDQAKQVGGTTLDFGKDDVCSWRIIADTQFIQDKFIRITVNTLYQTNCFINQGSSIDTTTSETSCVSNTEYDFDSDTQVFIVSQGLTSGASMTFTYQLVDRLSFTQVIIIYSISISVFIILAAIVVILVVRFTIQIVIRDNQITWAKQNIELKNIIEIAERKQNMQQIGPVEDYLHYPQSKTVSHNPSRMMNRGRNTPQSKQNEFALPWERPQNNQNGPGQFNLY